MRLALIGAGALVAAGAWLYLRRPAENEAEQDTGGPLNWANLTEEITAPMEPAQDTSQAQDNIAAFLMAIRHAEGTAGADGYRTMFGGRLFTDYSDHPRTPKQFTNGAGQRLWTSAAGAYQFMAVSPIPGGGSTRVDTWDRLRRKLGLPDFSPMSQDAAAVELIDEAGALADVRAGRFAEAVSKVRRTWASLPGAGYSQPEKSLAWLVGKYESAGGQVSA